MAMQCLEARKVTGWKTSPLGLESYLVIIFLLARYFTKPGSKSVFTKGRYVSPGHLRHAREITTMKYSPQSLVHTAIRFCMVV